MNNENASDGLSNDQRLRISNKFRAAKALLARKRQRHQFTDAKKIEDSVSVNSVKRVPLSEISTNTSSPVSVKGVKFVSGDCENSLCLSKINHFRTRVDTVVESEAVAKLFVTPTREFDSCSTLCSEGLSIGRNESFGDSLSERRQRVAPVKFPGLNSLDSFITPERRLHCSASSKSSSVSTILDEDFDDTILEEIDALCEAKSEVPSKIEGFSGNSAMEILSVEEKCLEKKNDLTTVFPKLLETEGISNLTDLQKCEEARSSEAIDYRSMPEEYVKYMKSLNDRQREAACCDISTPLIIVAGPGSGKTSTMVGRVLMLLNEGINPSNILAMTFTTAAASEMRDRIGKVAGKATAKELAVSTFHSFCLQLCRSYAEKIDRTPEFIIYGHGQQRRVIIEAVRLLENGKNRQNLEIEDAQRLEEELNGINSLQYFKEKAKKWQKFVAQAKASGRNPEDCRRTGDTIGASILQNYDDILKTCNALDYHDFISSSLKLLSNFPEVFKESQESWKAIVIDEFQDTSAMQYGLLRILASHKRLTIVGDEDQSIFSFNGADVSGFDSFRKDFPNHKEVRLNKNYRSTRCIVEAASCLIKNNLKRCQLKDVLTDNSSGSKITVKECSNEDAQCGFVVDKILEMASDATSAKSKFGSIAVLYRRQVTGKMFQSAFRNRKIPFNIHGVAFYRKKVVRAIISMLRTTCPGCDDGSFRRVFKALLPFDKEEKTKVINHIDKILNGRKCSFITAARDIFGAKVSGTFKRNQLTQGRKLLSTLEMISKLVQREDSISAVITSVANMIPQKYLLEQRAVIDVDGGKYLNEDNDLRSVLQYLLDDVSEFLSTQLNMSEVKDAVVEEKGCVFVLKDFIDYISERETENFRSRRHDNEEGVTLTTIHQSKGLEWDNVFIVKADTLYWGLTFGVACIRVTMPFARLVPFLLDFVSGALHSYIQANESEIPLLHEFNGIAKENCNSIEEERRLLYVAMTRARKKLFILYVLMDPNWQMLQPSRFLKEIPVYLRENQPMMGVDVFLWGFVSRLCMRKTRTQKIHHLCDFTTIAETRGISSQSGLAAMNSNVSQRKSNNLRVGNLDSSAEPTGETENSEADTKPHDSVSLPLPEASRDSSVIYEACNGNSFLKRFDMEDRTVVSHLFHQWAKKPAFKDPKRLLDKVGFAIDERLRVKKSTHKDVMRSLKSCLKGDEAFEYALYVLRWEQIPADQRAQIMREKQEHFQKLRIENAMSSSEPTTKQIAYLQSLGCTVVPSSRLHASHLIEEYKKL